MALSGGTGSHEPNPTMKPAPDKAKAADITKPFLSEDDSQVDWVQLMRLYPHAQSKDELRTLAMAAGEAALKAAEESKANVDVPIPGDPPPPPPAPTPQPDPHPAARETHR